MKRIKKILISRTTEYHVWTRMKSRCYDRRNPSWEHYGGRGIEVCDKWRYDFAAFLADMGRRPAIGYSIERINNDGNYEPSNCRWATAKEQANNRTTTLFVDFRGETKTLLEWADIVGIKYQSLISRIHLRGWSVDDALTKPIVTRHRRKPQANNL